jgi:sigma54-dependent transcription regulator
VVQRSAGALDRFDRVQLEDVLRVCRSAPIVCASTSHGLILNGLR